MENELTKQDILNLFAEQMKLIDKSREELKESKKEFQEELKERKKEFQEELKASQKEFDKKLGQLTGTWGRFVAEMVRPRIVELFKDKGIEIETMAQSIKGFKDGKEHYEIDMLLVNSNVAVVVEIKSSLSVDDVNEHLERLEKVKKTAPKIFNLSGFTIYGAVAGIIVENDADKYAYKKGLFVLRQKGNLVEIVNDNKFKPKEWNVEY